MVNYIGQFIPALAHWSTVLSDLTRKNVEFIWKETHQEAFETIKRLVQETPVCKPIDYSSPEPVIVVADASNRAIGGYYGQGKDYKTMQTSWIFLSRPEQRRKKLSYPRQRNVGNR